MESVEPMESSKGLSPLAAASHELVLQLSTGADPASIEAGCRELLTKNTNGLGSADTQVVEVAGEIVRGVLSGAVALRTSGIAASARGLSDTGPQGETGDAERLSISERACRDVRDSDNASRSDYAAALEGAAEAARMTPDELRARVDAIPPGTPRTEGSLNNDRTPSQTIDANSKPV